MTTTARPSSLPCRARTTANRGVPASSAAVQLASPDGSTGRSRKSTYHSDTSRWAGVRASPAALRVAGATVLRAALARSEAAAEAGDRADPVSEALAALPAKLGLHIVR